MSYPGLLFHIETTQQYNAFKNYYINRNQKQCSRSSFIMYFSSRTVVSISHQFRDDECDYITWITTVDLS